MNKTNIAVVFGGRSVEHDVSIITGNEIINNLDKGKYDIIPIYISRDGEWYTGEELLNLRFFGHIEKIIPKLKKVYIPPIPSIGGLVEYPKLFSLKKYVKKIDAVIPALHGLNGEDGTIQGLFELANIPYVGPGVLGSSVGMDKILMKSVFKAHELPILKYEWFIRSDWEADREKILDDLCKKLSFPMFVKPANLGSSIGISKAKDREGLEGAIEIAVGYDRRIIVEEGVNNPIEINCSVIGMDNEVSASLCEQPVAWEEFLSYEDKYLRWEGGSKGSKGGIKSGSKSGGQVTQSKIPADIPEETTKTIQNLAVESFKALDCKGVSRIDFLIDRNDMKVYVNEINTLPGSFSFYLWEPTGLPFKDMLDKLIDIAVKNNTEKNKNIYTFDNELLSKISGALNKKENS